MKKILLLPVLVLFVITGFSQLLSWSPAFPTETTTSFTITLDASKGNRALFNYASLNDVYLHTGVITSLSTNATDWRYVKFNQNFNVPNPALQATSLGNNKWQITITSGLRAYYGITNPAETIQKIALLFRNGNGSIVQRNADGSDMYIPVYTSAPAIRFTVPLKQPTFISIPEPINKVVGDVIAATAVSNVAGNLKLYFNGTIIQSASNATSISASPSITTTGEQILVAEISDGSNVTKDTIRFNVLSTVVVAPLPAGLREGINYEPGNTAATLVLYAPAKSRISIIGEFPGSNWNEQTQYQMNKTPDGNYWWLRITGLAPGTEYAYQYLVDGMLKIADPYTEKVLDPFNDPFISATTYPSLKPYPTGLTTGIVSLLQTGAPTYTWQNNSFTRPDKRNLMIYELLVRDFLAAHDWNTLRDTLNYIKKLGINTIEIMPFNQFEGNLSWGYNSSFYFAPDKYYGPKNSLKRFIDSCHSKGIAVVMDLALNHQFGQSPMVQLYFDAALNRPALNNPWFNPTPRHAFNVGYDMNHESLATRAYTSRVAEHWLKEYKIDGFRFDLSKGFTQTQTCDASGNNCNVNAWSNYDASRVAIWKRYYDTLQLKSPGSYAILEHFAANNEELELSDYGMLFWGNMNYNFSEAAMGYVTNSNFDGALSTSRGWSNPYLISYMESHDEERIMYKNVQFGNAAGSYNIKNLPTALERVELSAAFLLTMPGPKMIWQFGELGYDFSINHCQNGTVNNSCRTDPKPIRWDYLQDPNRKKLHNVFSSLLNLRSDPAYLNAFTSNNVERSLSGAFKWMKVSGTQGKIMVVGNFDVVTQTASVTFQNSGTWYDRITGATITATGAAQSITLQPGEYHVYLSVNPNPAPVVNFSGMRNGNVNVLSWQVPVETGIIRYELERSIDNITFSNIASVNATGLNSYSYSDNNLGTVTTYHYRLKTVTGNLPVSTSQVVTLSSPSAGWSLKVLRNPFVQEVRLAINAMVAEKITLSLTDESGRLVATQTNSLVAGTNAVNINNSLYLANGVYILRVYTNGQIQTLKLIKGQ